MPWPLFGGDCGLFSQPLAERGRQRLEQHRHSLEPRPRGARIARERGFSVALNDPFAGGQIVARHGRPIESIHAIQVEVDRSTYCLADARTPGPGFERVATLFDALATELGERLAEQHAIAAE